MVLRFTCLIASTVVLAACSSSGGGTASPSAARSAPERAVTLLKTEQVLSAYRQTFATPGYHAFGALQNGSAGFAAVAKKATNGTTERGYASVQLKGTPSEFQVEVDGQTTKGRVMTNSVQRLNAGIISVQTHSDTPNRVITTVNGNYATLAMSENRGPGNSHYQVAIGVAGGETPVNSMPSQSALYNGVWLVNTPDARNFQAGPLFLDANFAANRLDWTAKSESLANAGSGSATLRGNQFVGNHHLTSGPVRGTMDVVGAFYGAKAQEAGAAFQGQVTATGTSQNAVGGFFVSRTE